MFWPTYNNAGVVAVNPEGVGLAPESLPWRRSSVITVSDDSGQRVRNGVKVLAVVVAVVVGRALLRLDAGADLVELRGRFCESVTAVIYGHKLYKMFF
jgi:hypothetical protein